MIHWAFQRRVNNSSVKNHLGFICGMNSCIHQLDSFEKILIKVILRNMVNGGNFSFEQKFCQLYIMTRNAVKGP